MRPPFVPKIVSNFSPRCLRFRHLFIQSSLGRLPDRLIDWLIDQWVEWSIDWLIDWLIDRFLVRLFDWLIDRLIDWSIDWLIGCSIDWLIDWLIGCWNVFGLVNPCIDWLICLRIHRFFNDFLTFFKVHSEDVSNFDPEFTSQKAVLTPPKDRRKLNTEEHVLFHDFEYVSEWC